MANTSVDGLVSGLNTAQIISQLMQIEAQGQTRLVSRQKQVDAVVAAYQGLNTKLLAFSKAGDGLSKATNWSSYRATSSDTDVVSASASSSALTGTLSFVVQKLALAASMSSSGTVSSTSAIITTDPRFLISRAATSVGLDSLRASDGLGLGTHTIEVTQESAAASLTGSGAVMAPGGNVTINAGSRRLIVDLTDGGVATGPLNVDIEQGTWTAAELQTKLQTAFDTTFGAGKVTATLDSANVVHLSTTAEGSDNAIEITGGNGLAMLQLAAATAQGTDGVVVVGDPDGTTTTTTTLTDVSAGGAFTLAAKGGETITGTFSGGVRSGEVEVTSIDTGDGSLASVVSAINAAKAGMSATAVQSGTGAYRLQLASTSTGADSTITVDPDAFSGIGTLQVLTAGRDAELVVGSGSAGEYTITSASNTVSGVMPGVTLTLKEESATAVTVSVDRDGEALAAKVEGMVAAANAVLSEIGKLTAYDPETKKAGILLGDSTVRTIQTNILSAFTSLYGAGTTGSAGVAGIEVDRNGVVTFDKAVFLSEYNEDPDSVEQLFRQDGSSSTGKLALVTAGDETHSGARDVTITAAATQATLTGAATGGAGISVAETLTVTLGTEDPVVYAASAGQTTAQIAEGLNAAFAQAGLGVVARDEAGTLTITSAAYGSAQSLTVAVAGGGGAVQTGVAGTDAGSDVAGTFDVDGVAVAGTGRGRILTAPVDDLVLDGLTVEVTATGADLLAAGGTLVDTFSYAAGLAQRLDTIGVFATKSGVGTLTTAIEGRKELSTDLAEQIAAWDIRLDLREQALRRQFSNLEIALGRLQNQSSWLSGQLAGLYANTSQ